MKNLGQTFRHFSREDLALSAPVVAAAIAYIPVLLHHASSGPAVLLAGCGVIGGFHLHKEWREARRSCTPALATATPCQELAR